MLIRKKYNHKIYAHLHHPATSEQSASGLYQLFIRPTDHEKLKLLLANLVFLKFHVVEKSSEKVLFGTAGPRGPTAEQSEALRRLCGFDGFDFGKDGNHKK